MSRRVKEFVEVADYLSIDDLIQKLSEIRDNLPQDADAELRLRGDETFGRRITISYFRQQTEEEMEIERRCAEASQKARELELERRRQETAPYAGRGKRSKLRIVA